MKSLIGTSWRDSSDGKVIEVKNPATSELVGTVPSLTAADVEEAIKYAYDHQKEWENLSVVARCEILSKFAVLVEKNKDELAKLLSDETGKPIKEAYNEIANIQIGVPAYVGKVKHGEKVYTNIYPAIIDEHTWQKVQNIRNAYKHAHCRKQDKLHLIWQTHLWILQT